MKVTEYNLTGDGDFRSLEVSALRDQADFIITNPPFSLFREFMDWIWKGPGLRYLLVSNKNAITYKEVFPKIKNNLMWSGAKPWSNFEFETPELDDKGDKVKKSVPAIWLTNIDHGRRHQPLQLMTVAENLRLSKHDAIKGKTFEEAYPKYDNYNAINVDFTDAIPKDYDGVMGVPISFLDKYCPEQFEIIGCADADITPIGWKGMTKEFIDLYYAQGNTASLKEGNRLAHYVSSAGYAKVPYKRILIRKKSPENL